MKISRKYTYINTLNICTYISHITTYTHIRIHTLKMYIHVMYILQTHISMHITYSTYHSMYRSYGVIQYTHTVIGYMYTYIYIGYMHTYYAYIENIHPIWAIHILNTKIPQNYTYINTYVHLYMYIHIFIYTLLHVYTYICLQCYT